MLVRFRGFRFFLELREFNFFRYFIIIFLGGCWFLVNYFCNRGILCSGLNDVFILVLLCRGVWFVEKFCCFFWGEVGSFFGVEVFECFVFLLCCLCRFWYYLLNDFLIFRGKLEKLFFLFKDVKRFCKI